MSLLHLQIERSALPGGLHLVLPSIQAQDRVGQGGAEQGMPDFVSLEEASGFQLTLSNTARPESFPRIFSSSHRTLDRD